MSYSLMIIGLLVAGAFVCLRPRYQIFLALFVMTACFNLVPTIVRGIDIWDVGAVLLMLSAVRLIYAKPRSAPIRARYITILKMFSVWALLSLLWALLICRYPLLDTLKASRQLIIGYMSIFVLLRLWRIDPGAFEFIWKAIYWVTFGFLVVCIVQYLSGKEILFMLTRNYEGAVRRLPLFLPFCLMYLWMVTARALGGFSVKHHEVVYSLISLFVIAMTYTRGIYFAVLTAFLLLCVILSKHNKLKIRSLVVFSAISIIIITIGIASGALDKVFGRAMSGVDILLSTSGGNVVSQRETDDSFSGRLALARERFELVFQHNPLFGYSFIHEANLPATLKNKLQTMHGSVIYTPEYQRMYAAGHPYVKALYSADIGWANMVLNTGVIGVLLFIAFVVSIAINFFNKKALIKGDGYFVRLGLFLQVIALVILMFNGTPYTGYVQIPAFMIAGYALCTNSGRHLPEELVQNYGKKRVPGKTA
jgi:hypothetical protein